MFQIILKKNVHFVESLLHVTMKSNRFFIFCLKINHINILLEIGYFFIDTRIQKIVIS